MNARVFILMPHDKDVRRAQRFGEIVYLFGDENRASIWDGELMREAINRLDALKYDPETDYILAVGAQVPLIQFIGAVVDQWEAPQVLLWDMPNRCYVARRLGLQNDITERKEVMA